jgi:hypothetical protein
MRRPGHRLETQAQKLCHHPWCHKCSPRSLRSARGLQGLTPGPEKPLWEVCGTYYSMQTRATSRRQVAGPAVVCTRRSTPVRAAVPRARITNGIFIPVELFYRLAPLGVGARGGGTQYNTNFSNYCNYDNYKITKLNPDTPKSPLIIIIRGRCIIHVLVLIVPGYATRIATARAAARTRSIRRCR